MDPLLVAVLVASGVGLALMGADKALAVRGGGRSRGRGRERRSGSRIPEWVLVLGPTPLGLPGVVLGMLVFRHKTQKKGFWAKLLVPLALDAAALALWRG